jgi:general secretion pathway protein C
MFLRGATKIGALAVWLLVGLCAAFWGLKLFVRPAPLPSQAGTVATTQALRGDLTHLLGTAPEPGEEAPAPVAAAASRFRLIGVVAPRSPKAAAEGLALIAVDGKPAKAYRVGAAVDGDLVLQSVRVRGADLGARGTKTAAVALDVAPLPPPATGVPGATGLPPGLRQPGAVGAPRPMTLNQRLEEDLAGEMDDDRPPPPAPNVVPIRQGQATQ